jgi:hypothetical protein
LRNRHPQRLVLSVVLLVGGVGCTALTGASDLVAKGEGNDSQTASSSEITNDKDSTEPGGSSRTNKDSANGKPSGSSSSSSGSTSSGGADQQTPPPQGSSTSSSSSSTSGSPQPFSTVECGTTFCTGADATCCVGDQGATKTCSRKGQPCLGAVVECGGRSNCGGGQICCLRLNQGQGAATCRAENDCAGNNNIIFCRTEADCLAGQKCVNTTGSFSDHKGCITP